MITPYFRFDRTTVTENASAVSALVSGSGKVWAPTLCRFLPHEILQSILQWTHHASCTGVADAAKLIAAGFQSVLITRSVVNPEALRQLSSLAMLAQLTVVIDHFRHAELLSQAVTSAGASVSVLIDVDLGRQVTGVRPGPDSALLAAAIARMPNIQLSGVYVDDRFCDSHGPGDSKPLSFEESIGVALHCRRIIEAGGISCSGIVSGHVQFPFAAGVRSVTTVMASPFSGCHASLEPVSKTEERKHHPALTLVCSVISRPSLEWCVIDAGHLFWDDARHLQVVSPTGAGLLHANAEIATLHLSGEALDLRIGDEVILTHHDLGSRISLAAIHGAVIT